MGHVGGVDKVQERGEDRSLGHPGRGVKQTGVGIADSDIGRAIGDKGCNEADIVNRKGIELEFEKEAGMPDTVVGFFYI